MTAAPRSLKGDSRVSLLLGSGRDCLLDVPGMSSLFHLVKSSSASLWRAGLGSNCDNSETFCDPSSAVKSVHLRPPSCR